MSDLHLSYLKHYRNPKGWIEFWVGLVALIFISCYCGRIIYMEDMVKKSDAEFFRQQIIEKNSKADEEKNSKADED
jgi:hypothetical protein